MRCAGFSFFFFSSFFSLLSFSTRRETRPEVACSPSLTPPSFNRSVKKIHREQDRMPRSKKKTGRLRPGSPLPPPPRLKGFKRDRFPRLRPRSNAHYRWFRKLYRELSRPHTRRTRKRIKCGVSRVFFSLASILFRVILVSHFALPHSLSFENTIIFPKNKITHFV